MKKIKEDIYFVVLRQKYKTLFLSKRYNQSFFDSTNLFAQLFYLKEAENIAQKIKEQYKFKNSIVEPLKYTGQVK